MIHLPPDTLEAIKSRYDEPHRAYHNWQHIQALLKWMGSGEFALHDESSVHHAIFFHDAIYDPVRQDNEEESARLAEATLKGLVSEAELARIGTMIRATAVHQMADCTDQEAESDLAHFLDMDLSILGADWPVFENYEQNIRAEYAQYPDQLFWPARAGVLQRFLDRYRLYFSAWGLDRFEAKARENLRRSIREIQNRIG